jgi:hypothetical protein
MRNTFLFGISMMGICIACDVGQWPSQNKCFDCPAGFKCNGLENPSPCSPGTRAPESSGLCCPQDLKCPPGFAVDSNNHCSCVSLQCPRGHSLVQHSNKLQCEPLSQCEACGMGMIQTENCYCFRVQVCANGGTFWKSGSNSFACY